MWIPIPVGMKTQSARLIEIAAVSVMALHCPNAVAQTDKEANPERSSISFQVLQRWKVDLGDHAIFLNRIAPPILPPAPLLAPMPTAEEVAAAEKAQARMPRKKSEVLFLSATVHDHKVTEIRWMDGGHAFTAYSNIDFNLLAGGVSYESANTSYSLLLAVSNTPRQPGQPPHADKLQDSALSAETISAIGKLSATQAQYLVVGDGNGAAPEAKDLAALDALHAFYDANRQQIAETSAKREAARIEAESLSKVQPPKPPDTVVNFWPGSGTLMLNAKSKEVKP